MIFSAAASGTKVKAGTLSLIALLVLAGCSGQSTSRPDKTAVTNKTSHLQEPAEAASQAQVRMLAPAQYFNSIAYIFGRDIRPSARFAPVARIDGLLAVGTSSIGFTNNQVENYQRNAELVSSLVVDPQRRNFLVSCKPASPTAADKACARQYLSRVGRLLYRRPMKDATLNAFIDEAGRVGDQFRDFYTGLAFAVEGMMLSPEVTLIAEGTEPDPTRPGQRRLDSYSLASRLSLFLWNATPDSNLLSAAERGELQTEKGRARVVDMMLASPRLEDGIRALFDDMLGFDAVAKVSKDTVAYPAFGGATARDAREQTLRTIVDHLVTRRRDYRDLFTTPDTFMSPTLAAVYGVSATPGWRPYSFPADSPRAGLLAQISFLALHSHPARSSPTLRGKALREELLCQTVPSPPANVDFSALEDPKTEHRTQRDRINFHLQNPVCAGCHKITDPIGLALENFDGSGQYRTTEKGALIDASGSLDGIEFADITGLSKTLRNHPALPSCLVKRVYSYAVGERTSRKDTPLLAYLTQRFAEQGYRLPDLMRIVALSRAFSTIEMASPDQNAKVSAGRPANNSSNLR